jgi:hypothetical protein
MKPFAGGLFLQEFTPHSAATSSQQGAGLVGPRAGEAGGSKPSACSAALPYTGQASLRHTSARVTVDWFIYAMQSRLLVTQFPPTSRSRLQQMISPWASAGVGESKGAI